MSFFDQTKVGHFPFMGPIRRRIAEEMVKQGANEADAVNAVGQIGDGHLIQLFLQYGPYLYAIAQVIALMFGVVLPPLPPLPKPPADGPTA